MRTFLIKGIATTAIMMSIVACAGKNLEQKKEGPDWIKRGTGAFLDKHQQAFYGIGAIKGIENRPLGRMAADNRARAEIAEGFERYSAVLMADYSLSSSATNFSQKGEVEQIEKSLRVLSLDTLSGIVIIDHWIDPSTGVFYTLARLDLKYFKDKIENAQDLNPNLRVFVREHADESFGKFSAKENERS